MYGATKTLFSSLHYTLVICRVVELINTSSRSAGTRLRPFVKNATRSELYDIEPKILGSFQRAISLVSTGRTDESILAVVTLYYLPYQ